MSQPSEKLPDEHLPCDECGGFGALEIGDHKLCADCVALAGSACAGHNGGP